MVGKVGMIQRIFLIFCIIFVINGMTNGTVLAADNNVIIGFHQYNVSAETKLVHDNGGKLKKTFHLIIAVSANMSDENISKLKKDPRVAYVVNDSIYRATDEYTNAWGVKYIGSQTVYNRNIDGTGVKIAVLDTGTDYTHPDLKDNYKGGFDFVNNDSDPWDDNCMSLSRTCHGTHVSGTIAAEYNGFGVVGVAPGVGIYAVKVLNGGGLGSASSIISGIEWAVNNNMNIISMSLEGPNNTAVLDAVNAAYNSGILLVAAGGNTGGGPVLYPAGYDSVIAVTAIDKNDQIAVFSPIDSKIELAAPGVDVNSTICIVAQAPNICLEEGYGLLNGTSMAAPHVTGVAALILSADRTRTNRDIRTILQNTARHVGTPGRNNMYGFGVVDASNAILGIPTYPPIPVPYPPHIVINISYAPVSPVNDTIGSSRKFNITTSQTTNIIWYINDNPIQSNSSVISASYTNTNASAGTWNVQAIATNINGSVTNSWTWNVGSNDKPITTMDSPNGKNGWYVANTIYLNAADNNGIKYTNYSIDGGIWISNHGPSMTLTDPTISSDGGVLNSSHGYSTTLKTPIVLSDGIHSIQYYSVDNLNGIESTKTQTVKIDKTPPQIIINSPVDGNIYILNQNLITNWSVNDIISGVAAATGTYPNGKAISTTSIGTKNFGVSAADNAGNTNKKNIIYYVRYNFGGFLQPVDADGSSIFKLGSKVNIRFSLNDAKLNNVATATAKLNFNLITPTIRGKDLKPYSYDTATTGGIFKYDSKNKWYQYNLDTKGLKAGTWRLTVDINDGSSHAVNISLQK